MKQFVIGGKVKSVKLCAPLENVLVEGSDESGRYFSRTLTGREGRWEIFSSYEIKKLKFVKNGYTTKSLRINGTFNETVRLLEDRLIGYTDKLWFLPGDEIPVYVHSASDYKARLIRHGARTEEIMDLGIYNSCEQRVPDGYFVCTGLSWKESFRFQVPTTARPGLYSIELISEDPSEPNYRITFVLSTHPRHYGKRTRLLLLASTNNWQTYNVWGGRSRYRNFEISEKMTLKNRLYIYAVKSIPEVPRAKIKEMLGTKITVSIKDNPDAWQFKKLSIKRPHPNASIMDDDPYAPFTSHLAAGEWRVAAWLEREKIEYDIVSGYELHHNPGMLKNYDALVLNTHSEYWSREMYQAADEFNKNGGAVLNISGNSIYREIEYPEGNDIRCISLRFEKSVTDETQLLGVRFDMRGYGSCAPYKVLDSSHWIFEGTGLKRGDTFGTNSLNNPSGRNEGDDFDPTVPGMLTSLSGSGASGWETDKLFPTSPRDIKLIAKGENRRHGGAAMIVRENGGRGLMFSVSSITFGGSLLIDDVSSKILKNVITKIKNGSKELRTSSKKVMVNI